MKKGLRNVLVLAIVMDISASMTVMAAPKEVQPGEPFEHATYMSLSESDYDEFYNCKVELVDVNTLLSRVYSSERHGIKNCLASMTPEGYDMYPIIFTQNPAIGSFDTRIFADGAEFFADLKLGGRECVVPGDDHYSLPGIESSMVMNGVTYDKCRRFYVTLDDVGSAGYTVCTIYILPKAANNISLNLVGKKRKPMSVSSRGSIVDWDNRVSVALKGNCAASVPESVVANLSEAKEQALEAISPEWKSDNKGRWLEWPDGSYLANEWYQDHGAWYYLGADGYMLKNTTTPDGYYVDAEGKEKIETNGYGSLFQEKPEEYKGGMFMDHHDKMIEVARQNGIPIIEYNGIYVMTIENYNKAYDIATTMAYVVN